MTATESIKHGWFEAASGGAIEDAAAGGGGVSGAGDQVRESLRVWGGVRAVIRSRVGP